MSTLPSPEEPREPVPLSPEERAELDRLKGTVALTERSFILSGLALHKIHERQLHREYPSWDAFCRTEFDRDGSWGYLQMKAALAVASLSQYRDNRPCPRHRDQALLLAQIRDPETRQRVWDRTIEIAAGRRVTSAIIEQAMEEKWVGAPGTRTDPDAGPSAGARPRYDPHWAQTENVKRSGGREESHGRHRHDLTAEIEQEEPEEPDASAHEPEALHAALDELRSGPGSLTTTPADGLGAELAILPDGERDNLAGVKQGQVDAETAETPEAGRPGDLEGIPPGEFSPSGAVVVVRLPRPPSDLESEGEHWAEEGAALLRGAFGGEQIAVLAIHLLRHEGELWIMVPQPPASRDPAALQEWGRSTAGVLEGDLDQAQRLCLAAGLVHGQLNLQFEDRILSRASQALGIRRRSPAAAPRPEDV